MKNLSTLLAALFALPLAGCVINSSDDDDTDSQGTTPTTSVTDSTPTTEPTSTTPTSEPTETSPDPDTTGDTTPETDTDPSVGGGGVCEHTCSANEDCLAAGGTDIGFICDGSLCVPAEEPDLCESDDECVPLFSGWVTPCTMGGGECAATMQVCVDLGDGSGACATPPSEFLTCDLLMQAEVERTNLDDGSMVTVCANTNAACGDQGFCYLPCVDDTTCGELVCNVETGVCECDDDADCGEGGTCDAGVCSVPGCMDDADCMNPFNGGTVACN
jgi:hypothetical protein